MWNNNKTKLSSRYFFQISGSDLKAAQEGRWPCGKLHKTQPCRHSHRRCSTGAGSSLRPHTTDLRLCGFYSEKSVHGGSYVPEDKMATLKTLFPTLSSNTVLSQRHTHLHWSRSHWMPNSLLLSIRLNQYLLNPQHLPDSSPGSGDSERHKLRSSPFRCAHLVRVRKRNRCSPYKSSHPCGPVSRWH